MSKSIVFRLSALLLSIGSVFGIAYSAQDMQAQSVELYNLNVFYPFSIDGERTVIADFSTFIRVIDPISNQVVFEHRHDAGVGGDWLNGTLIYQEFPSTSAEQPSCAYQGGNVQTFGLFDLENGGNENFCIQPDPSLIRSEDYSSTTSVIDRNPFREESILVDRQFLLDVRSGQWQNISAISLPRLELGDPERFLGFGRVWWDRSTQLPAAFIRAHEDNPETPTIEDITLSVCSVVSEQCQMITRVRSRAHGDLSDIVVSPDGQTIYWSSRIYPGSMEVPRRGDGRPVNIAAFATDVRTGATRQIFQLYPTGQEVEMYDAQWSPDGRVLAISIIRDNYVFSTQNSLAIVRFRGQS